MAAVNWFEVRGQRFTDAEAREASDFSEILANFEMDPEQIYSLFCREPLSVAKRLVIVEKAPLDAAWVMMLSEPDVRIVEVVKNRIEKESLSATGGIHIG